MYRPALFASLVLLLAAAKKKKKKVTNALEGGGVKTERVFPGLSVLRKNKKMEVLYPEN